MGAGESYRLLLAVAKFDDECCLVTYFMLIPWMGRPSTFNDFTLENKGLLHFLFLAGLVLIPLFILVTAIALIRDKGARRKVLWMFAIVLALWGADLNWSTGEVANDLIQINEQGGVFFSLISIKLLGAGIQTSGPFAPWFIELGSPIGAIAYWIARARRQKAVVDEAF